MQMEVLVMENLYENVPFKEPQLLWIKPRRPELGTATPGSGVVLRTLGEFAPLLLRSSARRHGQETRTRPHRGAGRSAREDPGRNLQAKADPAPIASRNRPHPAGPQGLILWPMIGTGSSKPSKRLGRSSATRPA